MNKNHVLTLIYAFTLRAAELFSLVVSYFVPKQRNKLRINKKHNISQYFFRNKFVCNLYSVKLKPLKLINFVILHFTGQVLAIKGIIEAVTWTWGLTECLEVARICSIKHF